MNAKDVFAESYYTVILTENRDAAQKPTEEKFVFNDLSRPIRFRRQAAVEKFFELFDDKSRIDKDGTVLSLYFNEMYIEWELNYEGNSPLPIVVDPKTLLFEYKAGKWRIDWVNWSGETRTMQHFGEVLFNKLVKAKEGKSFREVYDEKICQKLGIEFDFLEWD